MLARTSRYLVALVFVAGFVGPVAAPAVVEARVVLAPSPLTPGLFGAYTFYQAYEAGVQASILVTSPTVTSGSAVANYVDVNTYLYPSGDMQWIQVGWMQGSMPLGGVASSPTFYVEYCTDYTLYTCPSTNTMYYYFATFGLAAVGSTHTFSIIVDNRFGRWCAMIDGVGKGPCIGLTGVTGEISAQAESHNSADKMPQGHVYNLEYFARWKRGWYWFNWDGWGLTGADPPFVLNLQGKTQWYYTEN